MYLRSLQLFAGLWSIYAYSRYADKDLYMSYQAEVWNQPRSLINYLYQSGLPQLTEMTFCCWFEGLPIDHDYAAPYLLSIAHPGKIAELNESAVRLAIWNQAEAVDLTNNTVIFNEPHKQCFTWRAGSTVKYFVDDDKNGIARLQSSFSVGSTDIQSGGTLVVMLEQDAVLGGFNSAQANHGRIGYFNIWDYEMSPEQVEALNCSSRGNLVNMDTLQIGGAENFTELMTLDDYVGTVTSDSTSNSCSIGDCFLMHAAHQLRIVDEIINTVSVPYLSHCAMACLREPLCHTIEYLRDSSTDNCVLYGGNGTKISAQYSVSSVSHTIYNIAAKPLLHCSLP